ncbi:unnamed protein product [Nippostrongylus brasiliensis]|uniref:F-box domain-containing protein n=1 Tax=Nippostrongylus brasiliensis TaxID=27835 RepID=A0A0N4YBS8_NIPBR|nr:unnamed protein product [Nippostrongylus brasiliensis]
MSAGSLSLLPPELIRQLCYNLSLNDILNLQKSHPCLELTIDNVFFVDLKHMENWKSILYKSKRISTLLIKKVDDATDLSALQAIERAEYRLTDVEIHLVKADEGTATVSKVAKNHAYRRLTEFMSNCRRSLKRFRLQTDQSNSIEYLLNGSNAHLIYAHDNDSLLQQQLIIPVFHAINQDSECPSTVTLRIQWREKPAMALQAAFHAALPRSHRSGLQVLKLDFGFDVASLSYAEIKEILSQYAPYLNDTRRLQHLVLDLKYSTLLASELETLYSIISRELPDTHRISVYTSESLPKANAVNQQKHTNRVACS